MSYTTENAFLDCIAFFEIKEITVNRESINNTVPRVEKLQKENEQLKIDMKQLRLLHVEQQEQIDKLMGIVGIK